jgi:pyrroloquinoline quinone (PQQ) biosynthesis protein C
VLVEVTMHKQFTEPIFAQLAAYRAGLLEHPLLCAARDGELPEPILQEFAWHQYSDSILWIPMLAQMKSRAERSRRLRRAIDENIAHEAGLEGEAHVALAVAMMRSLGLTNPTTLAALPRETLAESAALWVSDEFADFGEPAIAGFLLAAETLVPILFASVVPSFDRVGCDTRYLHVHVDVDSSEHAEWMREAVLEVTEIYGSGCVPEVLEGMEDAWEETRAIPDRLWELRCASR